MSKIVEFSKNLDLCEMELSDECFNKQRSAAKPIYGLFSVIVQSLISFANAGSSES